MKMRKMGKSEARQRFLPLVRELGDGAGPVGITEKEKTIAVLLSYEEYMRLSVRDKNPAEVKSVLLGSMEVVGDLEEGSKQISYEIWESIQRSAEKL